MKDIDVLMHSEMATRYFLTGNLLNQDTVNHTCGFLAFINKIH
jgi:hypothetical protein